MLSISPLSSHTFGFLSPFLQYNKHDQESEAGRIPSCFLEVFSVNNRSAVCNFLVSSGWCELTSAWTQTAFSNSFSSAFVSTRTLLFLQSDYTDKKKKNCDASKKKVIKMKTGNLNSPKQDVTIDVMVLFLSQKSLSIAVFLSENFSCFSWHSVLCRESWLFFALVSSLTCVLPSQSLCISVSSGPTVKLLAFFISSFCSVYASDFLTSSASPCPSIDSKARPAGFRCFPSRALRGSSSHSVPPLVPRSLCGQRVGGAGVWRGGPQIGHALCDLARPGAAWTSLGCQSWLQKVLKIIPIYNPCPKKTKQKTEMYYVQSYRRNYFGILNCSL